MIPKTQNSMKRPKLAKKMLRNSIFNLKNPSDLIFTRFRAEVLEMSSTNFYLRILLLIMTFIEFYDLDINI